MQNAKAIWKAWARQKKKVKWNWHTGYHNRHTTKGKGKSKICLHPTMTDIGIVLDKEADCTWIINHIFTFYNINATFRVKKNSTLDKASSTGSSWMKAFISVSALLLSKSWYFLYVFKYLSNKKNCCICPHVNRLSIRKIIWQHQ